METCDRMKRVKVGIQAKENIRERIVFLWIL
jgi:hypothetical protein